MKKNAFIIVLVVLLAISGCKSKKEIAVSPGGTAKDIYEQAKKQVKKDPEKARLLFKEVMQLYPTSVFAGMAKIGIADSYYRDKDAASLILAAAEYQEFVNLYPQSPDAAYASYQIGMSYFRQIRKPGRDQTNTVNALKYFELTVQQFPDTKEAEEAKKKIEKARSNLADHNFRIGQANYRVKAFKGAIDRFKEVIDNYPEFSGNDKTFFYTGKTYYVMKDYDSAISFFQGVINNYPKSKYLKKSQQMIQKANKQKTKKKKVGRKQE